MGRALAGKLDDKDYKVFVMMGDGETQEGSVWEAAMSASHYNLDNLVCIVDRNKIQQCGFTEDIMSLEPFKNKWEAFGWSVEEIDGHNMDQIVKALSEASTGTPKLILSNSIKGKGRLNRIDVAKRRHSILAKRKKMSALRRPINVEDLEAKIQGSLDSGDITNEQAEEKRAAIEKRSAIWDKKGGRKPMQKAKSGRRKRMGDE